MPTRRIIAGAMTGTSLDAIDAALVEVLCTGWDIKANALAFTSAPLGDLAISLRKIASGTPVSAHETAQSAHQLGTSIAATIASLDGPQPTLCAIHGQTVFHAPPLSTQLLNPWPITKKIGCDVVYDLRSADLIAAGQGAPITPAADYILFSDVKEPRAILNLGGFSNLTHLPPPGRASVFGADLCACNHILDAVARTALGAPYDADGAAASRGDVDAAAAESLRQLLRVQSELGRSLGSGDECAEWITSHAVSLSPDNLAATAAHSVGRTIRDRVNELAPDARIFLAGGGIHNAALRHAIGTDKTTAALGVDPSAREAVCMAILGALAQDGVPITLPAVTKRSEPVARDGAWIYASAQK